jgi:epoxyqueuosine reductase
MDAAAVKALTIECGFDLAGIARAEPAPESAYYAEWVRGGMAGEMSYLTGRRGEIQIDPRELLPSARSIVCAGKLYNGPQPYSTEFTSEERAWISRYAWGGDYHDVLRAGLERLAMKLSALVRFDWKICVDTAPLLERAYARRAGLGWIGKNTMLIREGQGSWFFLGELLTSLDLDPDSPPPDRCGTCARCIDACPTAAIVPTHLPAPAYALDSRLCISYFTIELRSAIPAGMRPLMGNNVFGCDICQDVCPWNRRATVTDAPEFLPRPFPEACEPDSPQPALSAGNSGSTENGNAGESAFAPSLARLAGLSEREFRQLFRGTPVTRARYAGFLRNVAVAMGNGGSERFRPALEKLAGHPDSLVREHASWALAQLAGCR